jgi:hypothetical protein
VAAAWEVTIHKAAKYILLLLPSIGAACWTLYPAAMILIGMVSLKLPQYDAAAMELSETTEEIGRTLQTHFLALDIYIPLEDIWIDNVSKGPESERLSLLMRKTCGRANLYVWIPISFRLPFLGNRTLEWCWRPELKVRKPDVTG